jgi:signal transduction histidine kinase
MTKMGSLRSRLFIGSLLWTAGLLAVAHIISAALAYRYNFTLVAHSTAISLVAVAFMAAGLSQVRRGLSPFDQLRARLSAVREGRERRIDGSYPNEVQPLVNDLNALLDDRERMVTRALAKAGDLAHGLKTPLAVLAHESSRAEAAGHADLAAAIGAQVDRMSRQVEYHLAHARAAVSGATPGARCAVVESADGLARTLLRLHAERGLTIDVEVPPDHFIKGRREDLDEMLGNLLDNACKWARSRVTVSSSAGSSSAGSSSAASSNAAESTIVILVDDDGPGLAPSLREAVLQRGVKADESPRVPGAGAAGGASVGSGFGLAIVRDLADLYAGSIALTESPHGGVRARLELPAA